MRVLSKFDDFWVQLTKNKINAIQSVVVWGKLHGYDESIPVMNIRKLEGIRDDDFEQLLSMMEFVSTKKEDNDNAR